MFSMLSALFGNSDRQDDYSKRFELGFKERMEFEIKRTESLTKVLRFLQEHSLNIEVGKFYRTLNDSVVYTVLTDDNKFTQVMVLKGGHGIESCKGEKVGEVYWLDPHGLYPKFDSVDVLGMCLVQQLGDLSQLTP